MSKKSWTAWCIYATKTDQLHLFKTLSTSRMDSIKLWEIYTKESWKEWHRVGLRAVKIQVRIVP